MIKDTNNNTTIKMSSYPLGFYWLHPYIPTGYGDMTYFNSLSLPRKIWVVLVGAFVLNVIKFRPRIRLYAAYDKVFRTNKSLQIRRHCKCCITGEDLVLSCEYDELNNGKRINVSDLRQEIEERKL